MKIKSILQFFTTLWHLSRSVTKFQQFPDTA